MVGPRLRYECVSRDDKVEEDKAEERDCMHAVRMGQASSSLRKTEEERPRMKRTLDLCSIIFLRSCY